MTETTPENARLTADAVLFGEHKDVLHVLLIRRGWPPYKGCWALPGGHVDVGEHPLDTVRRELKEETGLRTIGAFVPVDVYAAPERDPRGRYVTFAYTATLPDLPTPTAGDDAVEARWIPAHQALTDPAWPLAFDHATILHDALHIAIAQAADD